MVNAYVQVPIADAVRLSKLGMLDNLDWKTAGVTVPEQAWEPAVKGTPTVRDEAAHEYTVPVSQRRLTIPGVYIDKDGDAVVVGRDGTVRIVAERDAYVFNDRTDELAAPPYRLVHAFEATP